MENVEKWICDVEMWKTGNLSGEMFCAEVNVENLIRNSEYFYRVW